MSDQLDPEDIRKEVYLLTESSLRGEASADDITRLDQLLQRGDALAHYLEYISQTAALGVWAISIVEGDAAEATASHEAAQPKQPNTLLYRAVSYSGPLADVCRAAMSRLRTYWSPTGFTFGVVVAVTAFAALQVVQKLGNSESLLVDQRGSEKQADKTSDVAYLTSITGCSWSNESQNSRYVGGGVRLGEEIALIEGIAELRLGNGVYLSVEGPASLVIASPDSVVLQYGKITTHVPWPVSEFRVSAGSCQISATDAEFGVSLTGSMIALHVFSGEVLATDGSAGERKGVSKDAHRNVTPKNGQFLTSVIVKEGRALFAEAVQNGLLKVQYWDKANSSQFAARLTMAGQLPVTKAYNDVVMNSQPVGYWRFESDAEKTVENTVKDGVPLKIFGDLRISGLSGNRCAEFRPGSDCYLESTEPLNSIARKDYSVEVWVKPSHVHCGTVLALCGKRPRDSVEMNAFLLELQSTQRHQVRGAYGLTHPNTIRYLHRDPPSRDWTKGTSGFSTSPYQVRRWQHVVTTKQGDQMAIYIDGVLEGKATDARTLASKLWIVVGRQETIGRTYQFVGQLDELAIYPRALDAAEVLHHYQAIDWKEAASPPADPKSPESKTLERSS
jgi:concanavalin A-like lectin/glucanase superfamily protein